MPARTSTALRWRLSAAARCGRFATPPGWLAGRSPAMPRWPRRPATRIAGDPVIRRIADPLCALSQATAIVGDSWSWLVVQEIARGHARFDDLADALSISRKVLSERLR